jgi:hypothetical protein
MLDYPSPHNVYRGIIATMRTADDMSFVVDGFIRLLSNPMKSFDTYLPNSQASIEYAQELLFVLWRLLTENKMFVSYLCTEKSVEQLVLAVLFLAQDALAKKSMIRQVELCMYVLLVLSANRDFGVAMNNPYDQKAPIFIGMFSSLTNTPPNHFDVVIMLFFRFMLQGPEWIGPLYDVMLTILANISVYCKSIHGTAANRLVQMVEVFARPSYTRATHLNHVFLVYLMDVINTMIQYHYEGSVDLVLAVLQRRIAFQQLAKLPDRKSGRDGASPDSASSRSSEDKGKRSARSAEESADQAADVLELQSTFDALFIEQPAALFRQAPDEYERQWKQRLNVSVVLRLFEALVPHMALYYDKDNPSVFNAAAFRSYLQKTTLVGVLPVPHPVIVRQYMPNTVTDAWIQAYLWSLIFQRMFPSGMFDTKCVRLFPVQVTPDANHPRSSQDKERRASPPQGGSAKATSSPADNGAGVGLADGTESVDHIHARQPGEISEGATSPSRVQPSSSRPPQTETAL